MASFLDDVAAQPETLRSLAGHEAEDDAGLREASSMLANPGPPVCFVAMGSSLAAAQAVTPLLAERGRLAVALDAGELLHYGLAGIPAGTPIVAISQSGRSIETVRVAQALKDRGSAVIAVTNDLTSPLAQLAGACIALHVTSEANVATKTYMSTVIQLQRLALALNDEVWDWAPIHELAADIGAQVHDEGLGDRMAHHFREASALIVIARGPALSAATYVALTIKEAAAFPAEAMSGGAFRHGPVELAEGPIGALVFAADGGGRGLSVGLAHELAESRTPVWLVTTRDGEHGLPELPLLGVTIIRTRRESLAPLEMVVPGQLLAVGLARRTRRVPGKMVRASKVTARE